LTVTGLARAGLLVLALAAAATASACSRERPNLLLARLPSAGIGIANPSLMTDDHLAEEGAAWDDPRAAVFERSLGYADYDLATPARILGAYVQADAAGEYMLWASNDGKVYRELWIAPALPSAGLRARATDQLDTRVRFLRFAARGGSGRYSVAELRVLGEPGSAGFHRKK
jgi:hypothetical protein